MVHVIDEVSPRSVAYRWGVRPGDELISICGEELIDDIDYQALSSRSRVDLLIRRNGTEKNIQILKSREAPLGLKISSLQCTPRTCRNKCVFCFIDQMPEGMRRTLYVKDDDWRMSLMMGNYITLTNVDDAEFERIIRRKASPLYISVHATDPETRVKMMRNPNAAHIMERLNRLKDAGISFHCQIVLCPALNDGDALENTLKDLSALWPAARSAALVPVGLTKHRDGLYPLKPYDRESASKVIAQAERWQKIMLEKAGTRFVYPSDEMYCVSGKELPADEEYEGYPQIENGVGLLRRFENALREEKEQNTSPARKRRVMIPCGTSVAPVMAGWMKDYAPEGVEVTVRPVRNTFFGETVTVTGLLTGGDLRDQLQDAAEYADEILLCSSTLRAEGDLFLDDMSLEQLKEALPIPLTVVENRGGDLYRALLGK
ncbi:MAG: radical SAM protein [Clostridiales bacterium]|nr:radical SAM protein [Clostridiales bacterium]